MPPASSSLDRRRALAELARERDAGRGAGRLVGRVLVGLLLLALLALLGLWAGGFFSVAPELREIRQLVDGQVAELRRAGRNEVPLDTGVAGVDAVFARVRDLPPELRQEAGREIGRLSAARAQAETDSYFNLPPAQRRVELDRRIKAEEDRRKAREADRARRDSQRGGQAAGQAAQGAGTAGGGASGQPRGRSATEEERNVRSKSRIDKSSPQERARRTEYRRAIEERRSQLGLPTSGR